MIRRAAAALVRARLRAHPSYFRTSDGQEVDLGPEDLARLDRAADLVGADRRVRVSRAARTVEAGCARGGSRSRG